MSLEWKTSHVRASGSPIVACGVIKTSSLGAMRTTSPYFLRTFSIAHGYRPESLDFSSIFYPWTIQSTRQNLAYQ